jgi:fermentation-respiration switch protein FrsA (DUF1100 family)
MPVSDYVIISGDVPLAVRVHRGDGDPLEPRPTVVVTGSWLTVKEQMADLYAAALSARGFTAVTFDFAGFGASGGVLRQTEMPARKTADIRAVADFAATMSTSEENTTSIVAVCASAQYALAAVAGGAPVRSFAAVAGWFHDSASVAGFYGGPAGVAERLDRASAAAVRYTTTGELPTVAAYATGDDRAGMFIEMDYYANPTRGAIPLWRNEMTELTWQHWLTYDGLRAAPAVAVPSLFVHSDDCVFPDNVRTVASRLTGPVELAWGDGEQTDFYDRPAQTAYALDAVEAHLRGLK